jgi:putative intracellular protease/amidase
MKRIAYLLIFDGLADWEPAHALCQINRSDRFEVVTAGFSRKPISSMGGLKLTPDVILEDVNSAEAAIFILPGGDMWERARDERVTSLLRRLQTENVPIAAICAATLEIARAGLTHGVRHTSNSKEYLKAKVPDYQDEKFYVDELAVADNNIITASGLGSLEFARAVISKLAIHSPSDTELWFDMFKHGVLPAGIT